METNREQIRSKALEILGHEPDGLRHTDLVDRIKVELPRLKRNTISTYVQNLEKLTNKEIYRPERGLFLLKSSPKALEEASAELKTSEEREEEEEESRFYDSFGDYLKNELVECTRVMSVGGKKFQDKWGTPDVVGIFRVPALVKSDTIIVSAEIKVKVNAPKLVTAFGQACAYKVISHKVYLVIPESVGKENLLRMESLCSVAGIGLILFDSTNPEKPEYAIRLRAVRHEPELYYVNKYMQYLPNDLWS
jgi:hypothetical protein